MSFPSVLLALLIFGVLIFIHELGHFLAARAFGVKILEFSIGMGPKLFSYVSRKSGTRYSLRILPIGGYVSMYGENGMEAVQGRQPEPDRIRTEDDFRKALIRDTAEDGNDPSRDDGDPATATAPVDPELAKQAYCNKNVWVRIAISLAGPVMNLLLGFLLMLVLVLSAGHSAVGTTQVAGFYLTCNTTEETGSDLRNGDYFYELIDGETRTRILSLEQFRSAVRESADGTVTFSVLRLTEDGTDYVDPLPVITAYFDDAEIDRLLQASISSTTGDSGGLAPEDIILKVNRTSVHTGQELSYEIMNQGYKPITFTVLRNGEKLVLPNVLVPSGTSEGIVFGEMDFIIYREADFNFGTVIKHTFFRSVSTVKMVYDSLIGLFSGRYGFEAVSGPVGITKTISTVAKSGQLLNLLNLIIVISINLGVMNLLPIPALDGGHLLIYVVEAIRRKPLQQKVEGIINFVGLILMLLLAVIIAIKDVISL